MALDYILYSDLNCPFCYALGERLQALAMIDRTEWRGVQHAPHLPRPMASAGPHARSALDHEVRLVRLLAPEVPIVVPRGKPNTARAIQAIAAALTRDRAGAYAFAATLYRALWQRGQDISDPRLIDDLAETHGFGPLADSPFVLDTVRHWYEDWQDRGRGSVPELVRHDGESLTGLAAPDALRRFFAVADLSGS